MAARTIAATDTLETFRTQFNALSSQDFGDIATLSSSISATSVIGAVNELQSQIAGSLAINITDGSNTQSVGNAQTITFAGTSNQLTPTISATDTVTYALTDNVTIAGNFTASGTGTHTLGTLTFGSNTILSTNSDTITINDKLVVSNSLTSGSTTINPATAGVNIENSTGEVKFGSNVKLNTGKNLVFEGATDNSFETTFTVTDPTADRTVTFPDASGTAILTGGSRQVAGSLIALDTVAEENMADDAIGQDQLKQVVNLQIINSSGTVVKTLFGAGT